jgi:hypothetical protein
MTNNLKFVSMNFPAKVKTFDNGNLVSTEIVLVGDDLNRQWYATTTREISIIDLASDAPEVLAEQERRKPNAV